MTDVVIKLLIIVGRRRKRLKKITVDGIKETEVSEGDKRLIALRLICPE